MPLSVGELGQIVWAETSALGPGRADGSGDVNAVRRLVAQLAASLSGAGFNRRQPLPALTDPQYGETSGAIIGIAEAVKDAAAPQPRLIFWDAGPASSKLNVATDPPPPEPWASLDPSAISNKLRQQISDGRTIDVFSRAPLPSDRDGPPLVNVLTGTGLPDAKPIQAAVSGQNQQNPYVRPAWWIGVAGVLLCDKLLGDNKAISLPKDAGKIRWNNSDRF
jgi:hypothetical protein